MEVERRMSRLHGFNGEPFTIQFSQERAKADNWGGQYPSKYQTAHNAGCQKVGYQPLKDAGNAHMPLILSNVDHRILSSEWIRDMVTGRIITPLAVHYKAVGIRAWSQGHNRVPHPLI